MAMYCTSMRCASSLREGEKIEEFFSQQRTREKCLYAHLRTYTQPTELELELIQSHMAQKPMLRGEVGARALRVRSDMRGHGQVRLCKALGCGRCGCLKMMAFCNSPGQKF